MNHILKSSLVKSSIALACLSTPQAYAEEIEKIIITAKGNQTIDESLFTTDVFTEADIELAQVEDIPALLDRIAGVSVVNSGGRGAVTNIFIRGASNNQTIVLVDGIRVGSATTGSAALNSYPIEAIERIEIIKGPFSGIYGADAVAGVIQVFTKKGADGVNGVKVSYGSDNTQEYGASLSVGNEKHSLLITAQHESVSGFDRTSNSFNDPDDDADGFRESVFSISGKTTLSEHTTAGLSLLYSDSDIEIDAFNQTLSDDENLNIVLNLETSLSDKLTWTNIYGFNDIESVGNQRDLAQEAEPENQNIGVINSVFSTERETYSSELGYEVNKNAQLTFGADYYREDISDSITSDSETFSDTSRDNEGYYAQLVAKDDYFSFVASVRYDDNSDYGSDTNRSIAVGYTGSDVLKLSATYGTAFNAPTFNDLFFPFSSFGGSVFQGATAFAGNPDLAPEESESYEINASGSINSFDWRISFYRTDFDNIIVNQTNELAILTPSNVSRARIEGYEISLNTKISKWLLGLNVDVLSTEDLLTNLRLPGRAEETLNLSIARDFGKLDIKLNFKFEHDRFETGASDSRLPSYGLYDLRANYQISNSLKLSAKVENLFDKDFTIDQGFNTAGRQAQVSLSYHF